MKRYEEALASEKRANGRDVHTEETAGSDSGNEDGSSSPVTEPVNMFGALLGGDEDDDEVNEEDEEPDVSAPAVIKKPCEKASVGKKKRKKGKKKQNQQDDEDWYVGDTAAQIEAKSKESVGGVDIVRDPAHIPDSYFGSDDDADLRATAREVLQEVIEIAFPDGVVPDALEAQSRISRELIAVNPLNLSADTELKRLFGARVVEHERVAEAAEDLQQRRRQRGAMPRAKRAGGHLVQPRDNWWRSAPGLGMVPDESANQHMKALEGEPDEDVRYFRYNQERRYQLIQRDYEAVVLTHNPQLLVELVSRAPYHIDTLLQLGEVHRQMGELDRAGELVERALYVLEATWTRSFKPFKGECRLRYAVPENRSIFLALFRHVQLLTRRGLHRTALEAAKLYLNLDPPFDPFGALVMVDSLALLSGELGWIRAMHRDYFPCPLEMFPNFALSSAVAALMQETAAAKSSSTEGTKKLGKKKKKQIEDNTEFVPTSGEELKTPLEQMTSALLSFPMVLEPLLVAIGESTEVCSKYELFKSGGIGDANEDVPDDQGVLLRISRIYAETSKSIWKGNLLTLLKDAAVCAGASAAGGCGSDGLKEAAVCKRLRDDSARFFRFSGAYDNLQIGDFGGSAPNVPADLMAPEVEGHDVAGPPVVRQAIEPGDGNAETAAGPERVAPTQPSEQRPISTTQAFSEFFRSLLPWYTPPANSTPLTGTPDAPVPLEAGVWDRLQEMLARRDDGDDEEPGDQR